MKSDQNQPSTPLTDEEWEKVYLNSEDSRCIRTKKGSAVGLVDWHDFVKGIVTTVTNKTQSLPNYPVAKLNSNGSLSIFLSKCADPDCKNSECPACSLNNSDPRFAEAFKQKYIIDQLDYFRVKQGFQKIDDKPFMTVVSYPETDLIEYRFNISAENLDSLLKLNPTYSGYSFQHGILRLYKQFTSQPGVIFAFPVAPVSENEFIVRAAGCQLIEMPSVQLLHYMPHYRGPDKPFHWMPTEVEKMLMLDRNSIEFIIKNILSDQKMLLDRSLFTAENDDTIPIFAPGRQQDAVRIVDMNEKSMDFYLLYGNCSKEELENFKSLEISTLVFFEYTKKYLEEKRRNTTESLAKAIKDPAEIMRPEYYQNQIAGIDNAIPLIEEMIKTEKERLSKHQASFQI